MGKVPSIQWLDFVGKALMSYESMPKNDFRVYIERWIEIDNGKGLMHIYTSEKATLTFVKTSPHGEGTAEIEATYRAVIEATEDGTIISKWDNVTELNVFEVVAKFVQIELELADKIPPIKS